MCVCVCVYLVSSMSIYMCAHMRLCKLLSAFAGVVLDAFVVAVTMVMVMVGASMLRVVVMATVAMVPYLSFSPSSSTPRLSPPPPPPPLVNNNNCPSHLLASSQQPYSAHKYVDHILDLLLYFLITFIFFFSVFIRIITIASIFTYRSNNDDMHSFVINCYFASYFQIYHLSFVLRSRVLLELFFNSFPKSFILFYFYFFRSIPRLYNTHV